MPSIYNNLGVAFDYPDNWQLVEEEIEAWPRVVSVQTTENAFWMLQIHATGKPRDLAAEALKVMQQEYENIESEVVTEMVEETEFIGFDLQFLLYRIFLIAARIRSFILGDHTLLLLYQGEDREFDKMNTVFHAMADQLDTPP